MAVAGTDRSERPGICGTTGRKGTRIVKTARRSRYRGLVAAVALLALVALSVPIGRSYVAALTAPGNVDPVVRSVEWLRDNHMGLLVAFAKNVWYTINQPPVGGPGLRALPGRAEASPSPPGDTSASAQGQPAPRNVPPVISPSLPHEGEWEPAGQTLDGRSPILTTTLRPDPAHPRVVAGLVWMDTSRTRLALVPGLAEPESGRAPGPGYVPLRDRGSLLATFNSGFKTKDGHGGFIANGKVYVQPEYGLGTIAIYRDGGVKIGAWGKEIQPSSRIVYLRQNLPLLVEGGRLNPMVESPWPWVTDTVGNNVLTSRSGIGTDAHGNLIYVAAIHGITERDLAGLLRRAGAVNAMALDENMKWVDFFTYAAPGGARPSKLLPGMSNRKYRYLVPDQRDFFMVLKK